MRAGEAAAAEARSRSERDRLLRLVAGICTRSRIGKALEEQVGVRLEPEDLAHPAQLRKRGSARVIASTGDEHSALLMVVIEADLGRGKVTLPAARLYLVNDDGQIESEQVIFCAAEA